MAIAIAVGPAYGIGTAPSGSISLASTTTGHGVILGVTWYSATATISNVLINSQSLTAIGSPTRGSPDNASLQFFYLNSLSAGGTFNLTWDFSASVEYNAYAVTVSGHDTSALYDGNENGAASTGAPSLSLTTSSANAAYFAMLVNDSGNQTPTGATDIPYSANKRWYEDASYLLDNGSAGSKTVAFGGTPSNYVLKAAAFKAAAVAGPALLPGFAQRPSVLRLM